MTNSLSRPRLGVTAASLMTLSAEVVARTAVRSAQLGFESFWTAEVTGTEAFSTLAAIGARTPGLALGTGVLALQLRTPMLAAMGAATLQSHQPEIDVYLGVGISSPVVVNQWHGAEYGARPLAQSREYLTLVRECLSGEPVTFDGDFYQCRNVRLGVRLGDRRPRLVLGALNARMLALAGELADGVLLNYLPATAVPWCVDQVRAAEAAAGRPVGSCGILAYVHVGVADTAAARPNAQRDLFSYIVVDSYAKAFRRAGFGDEVDAVRAAHAVRDREAALAAVGTRMVDAIDVVGDADTVTGAVRAYLDAGVEHAVIMPLPWGDDREAIIGATLEASRRALD